MRNFTCVNDLGDLKQALNEAFEIKKEQNSVDDFLQLKP